MNTRDMTGYATPAAMNPAQPGLVGRLEFEAEPRGAKKSLKPDVEEA
jgi:hypothetical protein